MLSDMRRLVAAWSEGLPASEAPRFVMNTLGKPSLARARDTFVRAFRPRFLEGNPPAAWKLARVLEDENADADTARALYYWITARSEGLIYRFVSVALMEADSVGNRCITVEFTMQWLQAELKASGKAWTPTVTRKVARGLLAALRDFGILQGATTKALAPRHCPLRAFALIAFCLHEFGADGRLLVEHPDWRLFRFDALEVERSFLECHQRRWLRYEAAGEIRRIDFPQIPFKEYVRVVLGR